MKTPTYNSWRGMKERCTNPKHRDWARYGGRGITIDPQWAASSGFAAFLADMGERPDGMTLDRIDNDGPYAPGNCRWASPSEQRRNRPQPRGWKRAFKPQTPGKPKEHDCDRCGSPLIVSSRVSRAYCDTCRAIVRRETVARHEAKGGPLGCADPVCNRSAISRGLCRKHYQRAYIKRTRKATVGLP